MGAKGRCPTGTTQTETYDGDSKRVKAVTGSDTFDFYWTPLGMSYERKNNAGYARYARFPDGSPMTINGPDGVFFYIVDRSHNVVGIINASGTADWYSYARSKREAGSMGRAGNAQGQSLALCLDVPGGGERQRALLHGQPLV